MSPIITYLELSDPARHAHKFYEVTLQQTELCIRFGRIGDHGQTQTKTFPTAAQAQTEAQKKIREKLRKGYVATSPTAIAQTAAPPTNPSAAVNPQPAQVQATQPQPTSTEIPSVPTPSLPTQSVQSPVLSGSAPILWKFDSGGQAFGMFISSDYCWVGNQQGRVFRLDLDGHLLNQYQLPAGVKCMVEDDIWIYVGCDNGNIYDLTGKLVRLAYELDQRVDILWIDIHDGILAVSDANGGLSKIDPDGDLQWTRLSAGKRAWMVRADDRGFYHGHAQGVTLYDRHTGLQLWHYPTEGQVLFGWQDGDSVYAGTSGKKIIALDKATGALQQDYRCDASVYACATANGGQYVLAGDSAAFIYCFDRAGQRLWKLSTGCGSALSMQVGGDRLYVVTTNGLLVCIDALPQAIQAAHQGHVPHPIMHPTPAPPTLSGTMASSAAPLPTTTDWSGGVVVECVRRDGKLRIRAVSPGYHPDWMVQFPRDLRQEGARYWVEELRSARQGNFYRAYGDIKRLESEAT